jgi:putative sigma-54 modulation protein
MEITIKGRHWKPSGPFRAEAVSRIEKLTRFYPRLIHAELVLTKEGYRFDAELRLHGNSIDIRARAQEPDPRQALDQVLDKQERALLRFKDKMKDRKKRGATLRIEPDLAPEPQANRSTIPVVRQRPRRPTLSVEDAARALLKSKKPVLVFAEPGVEGVRVAYRLGDGQVGLIELD